MFSGGFAAGTGFPQLAETGVSACILLMPSRKGVGENLIAWGIIFAAGWVIHHYGGLATGWTLALIVAAALLASGALLLLHARTAVTEASALRPPKPRGVSEAEHIASLPAARRAGRDLAKATAGTTPARSRLAKAAAGHWPEVDALIRRGETLLGEVKELRKPVDPHTAQYEPQAVMFKQMSRASRYMLGATNPTNTWLADVARFVSEEAPARSAELYPEPVKSLKTEQAAIEQNLGVLREIADGILSPRVSESRTATILRAKHETAVLSAYQDILRTGQALREDLRASMKGDQPATPELHMRAEAWFKRCGDWASANLTAEQRARLGFDGAPRDSTTVAFYFGLTQRYVSALESAFRELF